MKSFSRAYTEALRGRAARIAEAPLQGSELDWQARWFSGACGRKFTTASGEEAEVLDFGEWNREAGPDFIRATVLIGGSAKTGAIEVDLEPSGWEQHGHAANPDYENVVLHVVVRRSKRRHFSRTAGNSEVPQVCLADHPPADAEWDSSAQARPGRCLAPLRSLDPERLLALLATAARRRIGQKAAALGAMIASRGDEAALYEAIAVTLGYKHNKLPFRLLAQRVPRKAAATVRGEALIFGIAGFLDQPAPPEGSARGLAAQLWASWWKQRGACINAILPHTAWKLAGVRPANHPLRRVAALGVIARRWKTVRAALESAEPGPLERTLGGLEHPFWSFHTTWNSPRHRKPLALIGPDRILDIFANVALPLAVCRGHDPAWMELPAGSPNAALSIVTTRLFGGSHPRMLPRKLFVQQGLLQIYRDFCLRDHGECAQCGFPALVDRIPTGKP